MVWRLLFFSILFAGAASIAGSGFISASPQLTRQEAPDVPAPRMLTYESPDIRFSYPENWRVRENEGSITLAPPGGILSGLLAYGMEIGTLAPWSTQVPSFQGLPSPLVLKQATDQLLEEWQQVNPNLREIRDGGTMRVDGLFARITEAINDSAAGGREANWIVTVVNPNGLLYYFAGAVPEREFNRYSATFAKIVSSVEFNEP